MKKFFYISLLSLFSCSKSDLNNLQKEYSDLIFKESKDSVLVKKGTAKSTEISSTKHSEKTTQNPLPETHNRREEIVNFAQKYLGTPYLYGSSNPENGFDCSGFINYVYQHFGYEVPRSTKEFFNFGKEISIENIQKGDLLIFNGTDLNSPEIGHIGIVLKPVGKSSDFIHSSSGKANGITITSLSEPHYTARFVKAISVIE